MACSPTRPLISCVVVLTMGASPRYRDLRFDRHRLRRRNIDGGFLVDDEVDSGAEWSLENPVLETRTSYSPTGKWLKPGI